MRKIVLLVMVSAVLLSGVLTGCNNDGNGGTTPLPTGTGTGPGTAPVVGKMAPDFTLTDLDGKTVTLSSLKGKPVLINFWATWCGPCFTEMPYFQSVWKDYTPKGLVFLSVCVGESASRASGYMQTNGFTFKQVLIDSKSDVAFKYGIQFLPTTIIIDKTGLIKLFKIGEFANVKELQGEIALNLPDL